MTAALYGRRACCLWHRHSSTVSCQLQRNNIDAFTEWSPFYGSCSCFFDYSGLEALQINTDTVIFAVIGILTPATIFFALHYPEPSEPCPCFDEASSFTSVEYGMLVGKSWSLAGYSLFAQSPAMTLFYVQALVAACFGKIILGDFVYRGKNTGGSADQSPSLPSKAPQSALLGVYFGKDLRTEPWPLQHII